MFGQYKRLVNEFTGVLTGKGLNWGGSLIRPEATGYGVAYFLEEMLATRGDTLTGKTCAISGAGNVAQYAVERLLQFGAKVVTLSDSSGHIYDPDGIDADKLKFVMHLKNVKRGRIKEYADAYPSATFEVCGADDSAKQCWQYPVDCAIPCATQNELRADDATKLVANGVIAVAEGANMPCTPEAVKIFHDAKVLFAPGKAANAGGVATSGLEMAQNSARLSLSRQEVDDRLRTIMRSIHRSCIEAAEAYGSPGNYVVGANIAGFQKVAAAMMDQGVV
jgi:glutamate dehydrogenase (NADP+)